MAAPTASTHISNHSTGTTGTNTPTITLPGSGVLAGIGVVGISIKNNSFTFSTLPSGWSELWRDSNGNGNDTLVILSGPITAGQSGALNFVASVTAIWSITLTLVPNGKIVTGNALTNANSANATHNQTDDNPTPYAETLVLCHFGGRASTTSQTSQTAITSGPTGTTLRAQANTGAATNNMLVGVADDTTSATGLTTYATWATGGNWFSVSAITFIVNQPQGVSAAGAIASAEAFGSDTITQTGGGQTVSPTGIASAEAFGSATVSARATVSPSGVTSAEVFGHITVIPPNAPFVRGSPTTYSNWISSTVSLVVPAATLIGDLLVAAIGLTNHASALTGIGTASGFTLGPDGVQITADSFAQGGMYYRFATAADVLIANGGTASSSPTYAWTSTTGSVHCNGMMVAIGNATPTNPIDNAGAAHAALVDNTADTAPALPTVSSTTASAMVLGAYLGINGVTGKSDNDIEFANWTTISSFQTTIGYASAVFLGYQLIGSPGAPDNLTGTNIETVEGIAFTLAIAPAPTTFPQTLSPTGIGSGEAFGTAVVSPGAVTVSPTGIASAEALGTAVVGRGPVTVSPTGIASAEALGTAVVGRGPVTVSPTAVASAEAFGAAVLSSVAQVSPSGVASAEAFGTAVLSIGPITLSPTGIASAEAFGTAVVSPGAVTVSPAGLVSAEAFGNPQLNLGILVAGVASAEAFGSHVVQARATVSPTGVASAEAFGSDTVSSRITISPTGIASAEAFGTAVVTPGPVTISPTGVASGEAIGNPAVTTGVVTISPPGIASSEAFGSMTLRSVYTFSPTGIASSEAFGAAVLTPGVATLSPTGIASGEAFGTTTVGIVFFHSFEAGSAGSSVLLSAPTDGSDKFDISQVTGASATITIDTAWSHGSGSKSFKSLVAADTAASAGWSSSVMGSMAPYVAVRCYARWTGTPPNNSRFFTLRDSGGGFCAPRMQNDGTLDVVDPQTGTPMSGSMSGSPIPAGAHVARIEGILDLSSPATPIFQFWIWLDGNLETASTASANAGFFAIGPSTHSLVNSMYWGLTYPSGQNPTFTLWLDDVAVRGGSSSALIGPLVPPAQFITLNSIPTAEAFGTLTVAPKATVSAAGAIASAEAIGAATLTSARTLLPAGIGSNEFFGTTIVTPGASVLLPSGIASAESLGVPAVTKAGFIAAQGVPSAEAFGLASLLPGPVSIAAVGIPSAETFGADVVSNLATIVTQSIVSAEAFGTASLRGRQFVSPLGVVTQEAFGHPNLINQNFHDLLVHMFDAVTGLRLHAPFGLIERTGPATSGTAMGQPRA